MTTKLKATLEAAVQNWLEETCEDEGRPDGYIAQNLAVRMGAAAEAVYDAAFEGQASAAIAKA